MIAPKDSTADTMKQALAYTVSALNAASELDVDLEDEDRAAFVIERDALTKHLTLVIREERAQEDFLLGEKTRTQARVVLGDNVLDRGYEAGKARVKLELKNKDPEAADKVFGKKLTDTTRAPIAIEPRLVLQNLSRLAHIPDFEGKSKLEADITSRANRQQACLNDRDAALLKLATLRTNLRESIEAGSDALYGLEKRLLDRFKREVSRVRKFFYDAATEASPA